jgi:hypothetical protein
MGGQQTYERREYASIDVVKDSGNGSLGHVGPIKGGGGEYTNVLGH